jgi:hypothetical protein
MAAIHVLDKHREQIVLLDGECVAQDTSAPLKRMSHLAHVLPLQRRSGEIEVPVSAAVRTAVRQRVHLDVKSFDDHHVRIWIARRNLDDLLLRCRIGGYRCVHVVPRGLPAV